MGKQVQTMAGFWKILSACVLFMLMTQVYSLESNDVVLKIIDGAAEKGAVCIDGSPAGYHFLAGSGDGANNWMIFLMGGGWCWGEGSCQRRVGQWNGGTKNITAMNFYGLLSSNQSINPDFYNWNRVVIRYCDGSSYIGDNEANDNGTQVQLRGSKIFNAAMEELLEKGLKNANNAILSGGSAGALAAILLCDDFSDLLPNVNRVKCLADGGLFIRAKDLPSPQIREKVYYDTVNFHNLTDFLPIHCTTKMDPSLCLFSEYLIGAIKTPLFVLNSAFDQFQIQVNMEKYPDPESWEKCTNNTIYCSPDQKQRIKDFGSAFLETFKGIEDVPSRGYLINKCFLHGLMDFDTRWNVKAYGVDNKTIKEAFSDWYFDRSSVKLIDTQNDFAVNCNEIV